MSEQPSTETVTIPLAVAIAVDRRFLPANPNKLRCDTADTRAATHAFKNAVHKAEQRKALMRDCPTCQRGLPCTFHPSESSGEPSGEPLLRDALKLIAAGPPSSMENCEVAAWAGWIASQALAARPSGEPGAKP